MNLTTGIVLVCISLAMLLLGRPRKGEDMRPFLRSHLAFVLYPALMLVFLAFGILTIVMSI